MQAETYDVLWLDRAQRISLADLIALSGMSEVDVHELVELGALAPVDHQEIPWAFSADCVGCVYLMHAQRLQRRSQAIVIGRFVEKAVRAQLHGALPDGRKRMVGEDDQVRLGIKGRATQLFDHTHATAFAQVQVNDDGIDRVGKNGGNGFVLVVSETHYLNLPRLIQ